MIKIEFATKLPRGATRRSFLEGLRRFAKTEKLRSASVGLSFVPEKNIQALNRVYLGKNRPTDVLAFNLEEGRLSGSAKREMENYLGDIVICPTFAKVQAKRRGIQFKEELLRLFVHGLLHLRGYDHRNEKEEAEMFEQQEEIIEEVH